MKYLTFALTKGRLASKTLEMLEQLGITCEEMKEKDSRKLVFVNEELKLSFSSQKGRMFRLMSNMEQQISELSAKIRSWKKDATYMRYWILDSAPAECVYAGHRMPKSFWSIVR